VASLTTMVQSNREKRAKALRDGEASVDHRVASFESRPPPFQSHAGSRPRKGSAICQVRRAGMRAADASEQALQDAPARSRYGEQGFPQPFRLLADSLPRCHLANQANVMDS